MIGNMLNFEILKGFLFSQLIDSLEDELRA